jgi:hypothetical protein
MSSTPLRRPTEDELDSLVTGAILRAEVLQDEGSPSAASAWREVLEYERLLAQITAPTSVEGGVARVGAVFAALAAGDRVEATRLAELFREENLPDERRAALERVFSDDLERRGQRFPYLARAGRIEALDDWKVRVRDTSGRAFRWAA